MFCGIIAFLGQLSELKKVNICGKMPYIIRFFNIKFVRVWTDAETAKCPKQKHRCLCKFPNKNMSCQNFIISKQSVLTKDYF